MSWYAADRLHPAFQRILPPTKLPQVPWSGFNLSALPYQGGLWVCVVRYFLTPAMISARRVVPGTRFVMNEPSPEHVPSDQSNYFMWDTWRGIEYDVVFLAHATDRGLAVVEEVRPAVVSGLEAVAGLTPVPRLPLGDQFVPMALLEPHVYPSDLRITTLDGALVLHDAYASKLWRVAVERARIVLTPWVTRVCRAPRGDTQRVHANERAEGAPYVKYFDKNWSILPQSLPRALDTRGRALFIDWFYPDGVWGVLFDVASAECERTRLVPFRGDAVPAEGTAALPLAFSLGSTLHALGHAGTPDYLGVGHVKTKYPARLPARLGGFDAARDALVRAHGRAHFKLHYRYAYAFFFFRLAWRDGRWSLTMSDAFAPVPTGARAASLVHSLISFPMSVFSTDPLSVTITMGYTDYHNLVLTLPLEQVLGVIHHDAEHFKQSAYHVYALEV